MDDFVVVLTEIKIKNAEVFALEGGKGVDVDEVVLDLRMKMVECLG